MRWRNYIAARLMSPGPLVRRITTRPYSISRMQLPLIRVMHRPMASRPLVSCGEDPTDWPADVADDDAQLLSYAERVRELRTDDANALSSLGFALFFNKVNFDVGIELVDRAIQSNPK